MDAKFATNVSNEMLLNVAKSQGYSFYRFWVIKGEPTVCVCVCVCVRACVCVLGGEEGGTKRVLLLVI